MIDSYQPRLVEIQAKMDQLCNNRLIIDRDINRGELIEDFYKERLEELSDSKSELYWIAMELQHLISDVREFNNKFVEAKTNPQTKELWETIETAMIMVK